MPSNVPVAGADQVSDARPPLGMGEARGRILGPPPDLVRTLAEMAARCANKVAVEAPDATLTFIELDRLANQMAHRLIALGVTRDTTVGISLPRSAAELVAMLATLKAGGAYVPLDPTHPVDRLQLIVEDAAPHVMMVHSSSPFADGRASLAPGAEVMILDNLTQAVAGGDPAPPTVDYDPLQLAYVLFTSGSTGRPKGVEIPRRAFANFLRSMADTPGMAEDDRLLAVTTTAFDIAGLELFLPLWVGATVVIVGRETTLDPRRLAEAVERRGITLLQATPTSWRLWLDGGWRGHDRLRLLCGGEALTDELASRLLACGRQLWNMYGPTETTVWSSLELLTASGGPVTIGRPIDETQLYVLDEAFNPSGPGIVGEIYIGGLGLARGYRGRAALTAERFIQNPRGSAGDRLYRTGDLGRLLEDGRVECLGRIDHQVKLRGFRIELGEIESALRQATGVRDAVVAPWRPPGRETSLVAYVVLDPHAPPDLKEVRRFLESKLPEYMVPSAFLVLDALPLNTNQKVDRGALPSPTESTMARPRVVDPPRNEVERKLVGIWESLLDRRPIGIRDSFFELGGTSLETVSLMTVIESAFGRLLPLSVLLTQPTIEQLAELLASEYEASSSLVVLRSGGGRSPLFLIHDGIGEILIYRNLAMCLKGDRAVYGVRPRIGRERTILHTRITDMADDYAEEIRLTQPHGPYFIGGLSTGGLIAVEVARRLRQTGESVAMVALFDTAHSMAQRKTVPGQTLRSLGSLAAAGGDATPLAVRAARVAERITRKVFSRLRYEVRKRGDEARDQFRIRLMRYCLDRGRPLPWPVWDIPTRDVLAMAEREYAPRAPYAGTAILFRATKNDPIFDGTVVDDTPYVHLYVESTLGWQGRVASLSVREVPGGHVSALMEPHVRFLARAIQALLDAVEEPRVGAVAEG